MECIFISLFLFIFLQHEWFCEEYSCKSFQNGLETVTEFNLLLIVKFYESADRIVGAPLSEYRSLLISLYFNFHIYLSYYTFSRLHSLVKILESEINKFIIFN